MVSTMLSIIFLYFICASMFTVSKWGLAYAAPIFFVAVRMMFAGVLLLAYLLIRQEKGPGWRAILSDWALFVQIIIFHIYLTYICDLCALKDISSVESAFIYNLSPFIAALFSYAWFSEIMTPKKWFGLSLGFGSSLILLMHAGLQNPLAYSWPRVLTLLAVISGAYGWIIVRALVKKGYSPLLINGIGMVFGGLFALLTSWHAETWAPYPVTEWAPFIKATILIVVLANIIFYNLYGFLLKRYTATFLSFAGFMCPLFAALLGYVFLGETFSPRLVISFVMASIGLLIFYHEELRQGYIARD